MEKKCTYALRLMEQKFIISNMASNWKSMECESKIIQCNLCTTAFINLLSDQTLSDTEIRRLVGWVDTHCRS